MKKFLVLSLCLAAFGFAGCKKKAEDTTAATQATAANTAMEQEEKATFVVGLDDNFPPMGFRDNDNKIVGFDIDLAREVAKRIDKELVLQPIDWASKELELNNGNIDCIWNGLSVDPWRAQAMHLSKPYLSNKMVYVVKDDSEIKSKKDINKKNQLGAQAGSTAVKACENDSTCSSAKLNQYENNVLALTDLSIGRVQAVVMDEVVARYFISSNNAPYVILEDAISSEQYAIGFKKGNTELANKVEKALADMAAEGVSDNISLKWFDKDIILK